MFTERVAQLLQDKGIKPGQMLRDLHFGRNQWQYWKKNNTAPNRAGLQLIADYLGTTPEYLTGETDIKEKAPQPVPVLDDTRQQCLDIISALPPDKQAAALQVLRIYAAAAADNPAGGPPAGQK